MGECDLSKERKSDSVPGKFSLRIDFVDDTKAASVMEVARILERIQTLVNHIGDSLTGSSFRLRGSSPAPVLKRCKLVFDRADVGSFDADLRIEDTQTLIDAPSLGESSLLLLHDISERIDKEDNPERFISENIPDSRHRSRIIEDLSEIWPKPYAEYEVDLKFPSMEPLRLTRDRRLVLDGLRSQPSMQEKASVVGVLATLTVAPKARKEMVIIGPDGKTKCSMSKELAARAKRLIGTPVRAYGDAEFDPTGAVAHLVEVSGIEEFSQLDLNRILYGDEELRLQGPVEVDVSYRDDMWMMENSELNIFSSAADYDECLAEFQSDFLFVWREYGKAEDGGLSKSARTLKNLVLSYVGGRE